MFRCFLFFLNVSRLFFLLFIFPFSLHSSTEWVCTLADWHGNIIIIFLG